MKRTSFALALLLVPLLSVAGAQSLSATSSAYNSGFPPQNAVDGDLSTRFSVNGLEQTLTVDAGAPHVLDAVSIAFYRGQYRKATFDLEASLDGAAWQPLGQFTSSGAATGSERFNVPDTKARFVRIVNGGNTEYTSMSINEVALAYDDPPPPTVVYVDCTAGDTLAKANGAILKPGDFILLRRGCVWNGTLIAGRSGTADAPITYGAYGDASLPLPLIKGQYKAVTIMGSYQVVQQLQVTTYDIPKPVWNARSCPNTPSGWRAGFEFQGGAHHNTVQDSKAFGLTVGVHLGEGSNDNRVLRNQLVNNTIMSTNTPGTYDDDSGAWGVLINSDRNEVAYNTFSGNTACSEDYGVEGASLEVYKASSNVFHHNTSINDTTLTELGGTPTIPSRYNRYEYNVYAPLNTNGRGEALVLRGVNSSWGDNLGTVFSHNTVFNSNLGVFCGDGCSAAVLSLWDNVIVTRAGATKDTLWTDGAIDQGRNVFYQLDGQYKVTLAYSKDRSRLGTSIWGDPGFVNPWAANFQRTAVSPLTTAGAYPAP